MVLNVKNILTLMKDIVVHCDKTIVKTEDNIKDTETHLKNITEREEYQSIEKGKRLLQQRKFKKFNYLKHKLNSTIEETPQPTKHETGFQKNICRCSTRY